MKDFALNYQVITGLNRDFYGLFFDLSIKNLRYYYY
jgi:hypothetical protein